MTIHTSINEFKLVLEKKTKKKKVNESKHDKDVKFKVKDKVEIIKNGLKGEITHVLDDGQRIIVKTVREPLGADMDPKDLKLINESKHDKDYAKDVLNYKYFVIDIENKKVVSGLEFKEDAKDALSDYDGDKNFKIVPESGLKKLDIENPKDKWINENGINENVINVNDEEEIFVFDTKAPFNLPNKILDYYVSRKDGKIGTAKWNDFYTLLKNNIGIKFGSYAYSQKIYVMEMLEDGRILSAEYSIINVS